MVTALIAMGEVLPDNQPEDYYFGVQHATDLLKRIGVEATIEGDDEAYRINFADEETAPSKLLNAQTHGRDKDGGKLYASDFRLLGQLTGFTN